MPKYYVLFFVCLCLLVAGCRSRYVYVVRHAEKAAPDAAMGTDVPLTEKGERRAAALRQRLQGKVAEVWSTRTRRTEGTVRAVATAAGVTLQNYAPSDTAFASRIRMGRGNALIAGHSNTVDDIVNRILQQPVLNDLPDSAYGDLFILRQKGKRWTMQRERFGD